MKCFANLSDSRKEALINLVAVLLAIASCCFILIAAAPFGLKVLAAVFVGVCGIVVLLYG